MTRNNERGQVLAFTALAVTLLMGFAGLAVDMGVLRYQRRLQQTAADAAAIAGASNLAYGGVTTGAQNASATNGFTDNSGGTTCTNNPGALGCVTVTVNNPPTSGPHKTDSNYVEVLVTAVQPTFFMRALGVSSRPVMARAVATNTSGGAGSGCLYTLGSPASSIEGININGSAILNGPTCGIEDNGNFNTKGNKLIVTAGTFGNSGDWSKSGPGGTVTCTVPGPCPAVNVPAFSDPYASLKPPSQPTASSSCPSSGACNVTTSGIQALQPGTYSSITVGSNSTANFAPGIYYINGAGGLTLNGNSTMCNSTNANCSGMPGSANTGVMFYFTGTATVNMTGTPVVHLTGLTSGTYQGILMYQDPADTNTTGPSLGGNSGANYNGVLYFPKDQITFFGNNNSIDVAIVVADSLSLSGNPTVNLQGNAGLPPGVVVVTVPTLVE
jgi:hypothetical protein